MKFKTLVSLSIFLHASFNHAHTPPNQLVARDTVTGPSKGGKPHCKKVPDNNPNTNTINCVEDSGPMDNNDCLTAVRIMIENGWNSTGYGLCGVLYWGRDNSGYRQPLVPYNLPGPSYKALTVAVAENTINSYAVLCCPEVDPGFRPKDKIVDNLPQDPQGIAVFCSGRVRSPEKQQLPYQEATHLTEEDIDLLSKQYEAYYPPASN